MSRATAPLLIVMVCCAVMCSLSSTGALVGAQSSTTDSKGYVPPPSDSSPTGSSQPSAGTGSSPSAPTDYGPNVVLIGHDLQGVPITPITPPAVIQPPPQPKMTRYVRLERTDGREEYLNINQIEVYDFGGALITGTIPSLGPPYDDTLFPAKHLTGASADGYFAHTGASASAFMEVDLGISKSVGKVIIRNRIDCCMDRIVGSTLKLLRDDRTVHSSYPFSTSQKEYTLFFVDVQGDEKITI